MAEYQFTAQELAQWTKDFSKSLKPKTVVLLQGPLGAGKTHLVQNTLKHLVKSATVTSPTFSLIQLYEGEKIKNIYHIDLYRLENADNLESTGFWDLFAEKDAVVFIEWSERLNTSDLPMDWKKISVTVDFATDANKRKYLL